MVKHLVDISPLDIVPLSDDPVDALRELEVNANGKLRELLDAGRPELDEEVKIYTKLANMARQLTSQMHMFSRIRASEIETGSWSNSVEDDDSHIVN